MLPGGVLKPEVDSNLDHTALRILATKTRVALPHLEQVAPQSGPGIGWCSIIASCCACEAIPGHELDKGAFPRQIKDAPQMVAVEGEFLRGAQRPAQMHRAAVGFAF